MFGKRHRRAPDDEPLVPHGLIWQAMDAAPSAETPESELENVATSAKPETDPPQANFPPVEPPVELPPAETDLESERPFWQRLSKAQTEESAGGGDVPAIAPRPRRFFATGGKRLRESFSRTWILLKHQATGIVTTRQRVVAAARSGSHQVDVKARVSSLRDLLGALASHGSVFAAQVRTRIREARIWERSRSRVGSASDSIVAAARNISLAARHGYTECKVRLQARLAARLPKVQQDETPAQLLEGMLDLRSITEPTVRRRVRPRILVGLGSRARVAFNGWLSSSRTFHALQRDSRLWTSFAMAGLSALLLLGFVSTVRHYAAAALPSHALLNNPATACPTVEAAKVPLQLPAPRVAAARRVTTAATILSPKRMNTAPIVKAGQRHSEDDDYVARDTFISYENRRNSSR